MSESINHGLYGSRPNSNRENLSFFGAGFRRGGEESPIPEPWESWKMVPRSQGSKFASQQFSSDNSNTGMPGEPGEGP